MMFFVVFLACQEQSALQGVGYGHEVRDEEKYFLSSENTEGIDASGFEFLPEELEVSLMVNEYRQENGLPPMTLVEEFSLLARNHSMAMAEGEVELGHEGFFERYQMATMIAELYSAGENVGMNYSVQDPVRVAISNWIDSDGHLENIEGGYNLTGVGISVSDEGAMFFTQLFFSGQVFE